MAAFAFPSDDGLQSTYDAIMRSLFPLIQGNVRYHRLIVWRMQRNSIMTVVLICLPQMVSLKLQARD
jgi:hypothetical protein